MFSLCTDAGKSFGEIALISEDSVRNATVIADEETDLMVIHRDLFNRSMKVRGLFMVILSIVRSN